MHQGFKLHVPSGLGVSEDLLQVGDRGHLLPVYSGMPRLPSGHLWILWLLCGLHEGLLQQWRQEVLLLQRLHPGAGTISKVGNTITITNTSPAATTSAGTTSPTSTSTTDWLHRQVVLLQPVLRLLQPLRHAQRR